MMTILLERQEYLRATHSPRQTCSLAMAVASKYVSESCNNLLPLTALLLKDQPDCEIPAAKIWPPIQGPVRDCIRPYFSERPT